MNKLNQYSVKRCDRCGQDAPSFTYDQILDMLLCTKCNQAIQIKRAIHISFR
jgi:hypothetical protein